MAVQITFKAAGAPLDVTIETLIVAGWTGRDALTVKHHIAELAALGVAPPSSVPLFYRVAAPLLTTTDTLQVLGEETSGEVEPLLVHDGQTLWLGLASDHTDRGLEAVSVAHAKQACGKPVARGLWRFDDFADRLDQLELSSHIRDDPSSEWEPYQEGTLAAIRPLRALLAGLPGGSLQPRSAMLCGTLGAIGGVRPARQFRMQLDDPATGRRLRHSYTVQTLPLVA